MNRVSFFGGIGIFLCIVINITGRRVSRQTYEGVTCTLPPHPENGQWRLLNGHAQPGDKIQFSTIIQFSCNDGYKLRSRSSYVVCTRDFDKNVLPTCARMCPPMYSTPTTTLRCVDESNEDIDCAEAIDGTYMTYSCPPYYEPPLGFRRRILCLEGRWNYAKPVCQPVCGKKILNDNSPLIVGGTDPKRIEYPWIVAIYKMNQGEFVYICGGSLISRRVVLTAAHCLTDENGEALPKEDFRVGIGKYYSKYQEPSDDQAQYLEALKIITRDGYKGPRRNYIEDIGLIITKRTVTLSSVVQLVCISDIRSLNVGNVGEIAAWGARADGRMSESLRKLQIPYKDQGQCAAELNLQDEFADRFNLIDKMCAGFYNQNVSVCKGDSGSGLVFRNPDDNRYYIHGIVSIGPSIKGMCSINQNTLYTKVSFYYDFLDREMTRNYEEDCRLPSQPENGNWTIESDVKKSPGDIVSSTTTLKVSCADGYQLDGEPFISCESAVNMPSCDKKCNSLSFPPGSRVNCLSKYQKSIDCRHAADGSIVQYNCLDNNGSFGEQKFRQCLDGSWGLPIPTCPRVESTSSTIIVPSPPPIASSAIGSHYTPSPLNKQQLWLSRINGFLSQHCSDFSCHQVHESRCLDKTLTNTEDYCCRSCTHYLKKNVSTHE